MGNFVVCEGLDAQNCDDFLVVPRLHLSEGCLENSITIKRRFFLFSSLNPISCQPCTKWNPQDFLLHGYANYSLEDIIPYYYIKYVYLYLVHHCD